ncbi:MAG: helix-turn-helix transcriptional regulator [Anaerotignum sp.]|nr:helix-turn-helix transcriptional regulator [Anaerotignum sp.]
MKIYEYNGKKNISGKNLKKIRRQKNMSQETLSHLLQLEGVVIDRFSISRIEAGTRFVADYELYMLAKVLDARLEDFFVPEQLSEDGKPSE